MNEITDEFLTQFSTDLVVRYSLSKSIYITFRMGAFSDTHIKFMQKIAKLYGLKIKGYGVLPRDGKLLVTFVLTERKGVKS
jgi:hypothetical protein